MRTRRVLLGELVIGSEPAIELRAELPCREASKKAAVLKDRLAYLLDTRFRPAEPEPPETPGLTVEEVAESLHCRCRTVLQMIRRGKLHPVSDEDGELYFDPAEVANVTHVPINSGLSRLVPRN
jgi:excisionase family DNA binding protein